MLKQTLLLGIVLSILFYFNCENINADEPKTPDEPKPEDLITNFSQGEAPFFRNGAAAETNDASTLASHVSALFLQNYIKAYYVTKDAVWLDKLMAGANTMINFSFNNGKNQVWMTKMGSIGRGWIKADQKNKGTCQMLPPYQGVRMTNGGDQIKGHSFTVEFTEPDRFQITDDTAKTVLKKGELYEEGRTYVSVPGLRFSFKNKPEPGDKFIVTTAPPEKYDQIFEDAVIALPMVQFAELVLKDDKLSKNAKYADPAKKYLEFVQKNIVQKWERCWEKIDDTKGTYKFDDLPSLRFPADYLPHHQNLAMGRIFIALMNVPNIEKKNEYKKRAEMIANYFKSKLQKKGHAYLWCYIDKKKEDKAWTEIYDDTATSIHVVGFIMDAYLNNIVFTKDDLNAIAETLIKKMWNRNKDAPGFGKTINSNQFNPEAKPIPEWINLGVVSPEAWDVMMNFFQKTMCDEQTGKCNMWYVAPHVAYAIYLKNKNPNK